MAVLLPCLLFAQLGPGGVSVETFIPNPAPGHNQSTCRLWYDANTLTTLVDGDNLSTWDDISASEVNDQASVKSGYLPPYYRDNAAYTINGYPVVTFEDGRFLKIGASASSDINMSGVTNSKTVFVAFRTSTNISSKQVIYEEDGSWRGFNIYIADDSVYVGGHDFNRHGYLGNSGNPNQRPCKPNNQTDTDEDCTPQWGYTYVSRRIEANTTYILSAQYYAKDPGIVANNDDYYIRAWINGNSFGPMKVHTDYTLKYQSVYNGPRGVGTLSSHDNPIGLGAANSHFVDQHIVYDSDHSGQFSFQGRMAEYIYYIDLLSETQRIIVENYLGAKYFANILPLNDKYEHQANYGNEVIGIGQNNPPAGNHNLSQGRNPFSISEQTVNPISSNHFFLTGHNGANLLLTSEGVPDNSTSIQRLERIWQVDETGTFGTITLEIDEDDIPAKPGPEYSKLVLLVDNTSMSFPNFSLPTTVVKEIPVKLPLPSTVHRINYDFADNAFFTFAWLKPEVEFIESEASGLESDAPPSYSPFSVDIKLNYDPISTLSNTMDYLFVDAGQTAESVDYQYIPSSTANGITIPASQRTASLTFDIYNDNISDDESTEQFLIILKSGPNTTAGLGVGERDTLVFSILDDDPPPTGGFVNASANVSESAGYYYVKFRRTGNPSAMNSTSSKIRIRRKANPNEGTATYDTDYTLKTADGWLGSAPGRYQDYTFPAAMVSSQLDSIRIEITDDSVNEQDETIKLTLEGRDGFAISPSSIIKFTLNIIEDDPIPKANFLVDNQTGYEIYGDPSIAIQLDRRSTRSITVKYSINTGVPNSATYMNDYSGTGVTENGEVHFPAGDTIAYVGPFFVTSDQVLNEEPEVVVFNLISAVNATIGTNRPQHTYTILDYAPFEWKGAAGVGQSSDNIVWLDATRMDSSSSMQFITNYSPRDIKVKAKTSSNYATLVSNGINGKQSIQFDGNSGTNADYYRTTDNPFINFSGAMERKAFFLVIRPTSVPTAIGNSSGTTYPTNSYARLIYEQGGAWRGMSIYLYNKKLYFNAWNGPTDEGQTSWGIDVSPGGDPDIQDAVYARSSQDIVANNSYIVSCHFDRRNPDEPIMIYVNGVKGVMQVPTTTTVGKLYNHNSIAYGANIGSTLFHFSKKAPGSAKSSFQGLLSEFIMYFEPPMNEARRVIVSNYLSAKYNIPLDDSDTPQVFDLSYADWDGSPSTDFSRDVCGVGQRIIGSETYEHLDAQGADIMRINIPIFSGNQAYMVWGHNDKKLTNTWPYSYWNADLPAGIEERSGRVWKIFEKPGGTVSKADILINFSASTNAAALQANDHLLKLLVHPGSDPDPQDFSTATVYDAEAMLGGYVAYFKEVPITGGMYITLGNTSPINLSPLPIELLDFDAKLAGNHVDISWVTASEKNNAIFQVERAGRNLKWDKILQTPGAGNSNNTLYYKGKDRNPLQGVSYYRLKQIDFDGNYQYSNVVSVVNTGPNGADEFSIYPNPNSNGIIKIILPPEVVSVKTNLEITDVTGVVLFSKIIDSDQNRVQVNYGDLPPGVYLISLKNQNFREVRKLIIDK